jgi:cell division control protein 6
MTELMIPLSIRRLHMMDKTAPPPHTVFKDRERLLPDFPIEKYWNSLPHREEQVSFLWNIYGSILERPSESFLRIVQIIGPAGTGKSCTLRLFGDRFEKEAAKRRIDLKHVYINLKLAGGRRVVLYRNLLGKVDRSLASPSLSAEEMLRNLVEYLHINKRLLLLTVDEIDYYVTHFRDEGVVYDLTRLGELSTSGPSGVVGATFLARDTKFYDALDPAELSTLGRIAIQFPSYSTQQIEEILEKRANEALNNGTYSSDVLEFIADVTARPPANGDMRYALDLLLYSGNLADNLGSDKILSEHVRMVHSQTNHLITTEDILNLPAEERLVLMAIARILRNKRSPYVPLKDVRSMVAVVCEEYKSKHITPDDLEDHIQDLADRGIIDMKGINQIGVSGVALDDMDKLLSNIMDRVRDRLG